MYIFGVKLGLGAMFGNFRVFRESRAISRSRTNPSIDRFHCHARILKVICTGIGWIWLVRLYSQSIYLPVHRPQEANSKCRGLHGAAKNFQVLKSEFIKDSISVQSSKVLTLKYTDW